MNTTLVVYESMFGNTRAVAEAIADGLRAGSEVELLEVSAAGAVPPALDLLVVGGPTHAFGLSRASTRADAAAKSHREVESAVMGVREWLDSLDPAQTAAGFATFDTRVSHPRVPGSAAKKAAKRLRRLGLQQAAGPETFWVHGLEGPLEDGELDRAREWGRALLDAAGPGGQPVALHPARPRVQRATGLPHAPLRGLPQQGQGSRGLARATTWLGEVQPVSHR